VDANPYEAHLGAIAKAIGRVCRHYRLSRADADDFSQDVWIHLFEKRGRIDTAFAGRCTYATYLSRIIWNYGANWRRAQRRLVRRLVWIDDVPAVGLPTDTSASMPRLEREPLDPSRRRLVASVLICLTSADRQLLCQWASNVPVTRVAATLGISTNAAYCRMSRLRRKLRLELHDVFVDDNAVTAVALDERQQRLGNGGLGGVQDDEAHVEREESFGDRRG
jgi:RNA polymerase sigma factor (sigma-70 family)